MADSRVGGTAQKVVQKKKKPGSLRRTKPVNKSNQRPSIKRSDADIVESGSEEEYFDTVSYCNPPGSPGVTLSGSEWEPAELLHTSVRRKTIPYEPGKLTPPLPRKKEKVKKRRATEPNCSMSEAIEKIKEETKLVVIEYLSVLPADELRARNRNVVKAKTIQFGEKPLVEYRPRTDSDLRRSTSDVGNYREEVRKKLQSLAVPLKRMRSVSPTLLREIESFDKRELRKKKPSDALNLPIERVTQEERALNVPSPETQAVRKLEWISKQILDDFPQLLDQPISDLTSPLDSGKELTYEAFSAIAKQPFTKQVSMLNGRGALWARVALTFYLVREVILVEEVNDTQLELLVEYASKFVAENMYEWISKSHSLGDLKLKEDILNATGSIFDSIDSSDNDDPDGPCCPRTSFEEEKSSVRTKITNVVNDWVTYGVAALAVGIGIAYNYFKQ